MHKNKGFTLIELMTAVSIFLVIMTISMGSILTVFDLNRKSRSMKNVVTSLNVAMESMSKEMRYGRLYHCGLGFGTVVPTPHNSMNCYPTSGPAFVRFVSSENQIITYRFHSQSIERRVASGQWVKITSPEVIIEDVTFSVAGEQLPPPNDPFVQPKVFIKIRAKAGTDSGETVFTLQTMVSQRFFLNS